MYYCRWCGIQAGWPTNYVFAHVDECCLCGTKGKCTCVPYKRILQEIRDKNLDIPHEDLIKELEALLSSV